MSDALDLCGKFPPHDLAAWRAVVDRDLKGASFEKRLVTRTLEGIEIQPLYTAANGDPADARSGFPGLGTRTRGNEPTGRPAGWTIAVDAPRTGDAAQVVEALREDLAHGARGVNLSLTATADASFPLLGGLLRDAPPVSVFLDGGAQGQGEEIAPLAMRHGAELVAAWNAAKTPAPARRGSLGADPLGQRARGEAFDMDQAIIQLGGLLHMSADHPGVRAIEVRADGHHDRGAHAAQELALGIAAGIHYLRALEPLKLDLPQIAAEIGFTFAVGRDLFTGIAKLRAARRLWARVLEVCGVSGVSAPLHARVARRIYSAYDPMVNALRATNAAFAAAVGGAERLTVPPHDAALSTHEAGSRRLARNLQLILQEESHLHRVVDPAGGAYYVEALTDRLAEAAWTLVQEVEGQGGLAAALERGWVDEQLAASREARAVRIAKRKDAIVGVSEFPDLGEPPRRPIDGDLRLSGPWEALRVRSDEVAAERGARPRVFLASLGSLAVHNGRTTWIRNLLAAGGLEGVGAADYETAAEAAQSFKTAGARLAVICSSDAVYAERGAETARALKNAGATQVLLAGRPTPDLEAAGVDRFVHLGVDVLAVLRSLWEVVL